MGYIEGRQGNQVKAEVFFQDALKANPDLPDALLELANLRILTSKTKRPPSCCGVTSKSAREPAAGYYKLAMVERSLQAK